MEELVNRKGGIFLGLGQEGLVQREHGREVGSREVPLPVLGITYHPNDLTVPGRAGGGTCKVTEI